MPEQTLKWIEYAVFCHQGLSCRKVRHMLLLRWMLWQEGVKQNAIPGYEQCPPDEGKGYPRGWSQSAFGRISRRVSLASPLSLNTTN